jgi:hypothetical protein
VFGSSRSRRPPRRRRGGCLARRAATQSTARAIAAVVKVVPVRQLGGVARRYQHRGGCRARPLLVGGCASGESDQLGIGTSQAWNLASQACGALVPSSPWWVASGGGDQESGPAFAPRLLSHARIDRPASVICPPPWPVVARARVTPFTVDQPNSIPVPEGA